MNKAYSALNILGLANAKRVCVYYRRYSSSYNNDYNHQFSNNKSSNSKPGKEFENGVNNSY